MPSNYDNSATFYDQLSRIMFGKALINAQVYLLHFIPPNSTVLIVGGGTGWILEELSHIHYSGLQITYVEISSKMTYLAKKKNTGNNQVEFINDAVENTPVKQIYDVVLTPFVLDSFTEETLQKTFPNIHSRLKPQGLWLFADFDQPHKLWQKILLKSMYLFFKVICRIETLNMPDIQNQFVKHGYKPLTSKTFYSGFIAAIKYQKR